MKFASFFYVSLPFFLFVLVPGIDYVVHIPFDCSRHKSGYSFFGLFLVLKISRSIVIIYAKFLPFLTRRVLRDAFLFKFHTSCALVFKIRWRFLD